MDRRTFLSSLSAAGILPLAPKPILGHSARGEEPHFLIHVIYGGGWDGGLLCDARPRSFMDAGVMANFNKEDPLVWEGRNQSTLTSSLFRRLQPYKDELTLCNGVLMSTGFDGHEQNFNHAFTANAFGGISYLPLINQVGPISRPLDAIRVGRILLVSQNSQAVVGLEPSSARNLIEQIRDQSEDRKDALGAFIRRQLQPEGAGLFSTGREQILAGLKNSSSIKSTVARMDPARFSTENETLNKVHLILEAFRAGVTSGALLTRFDYNLDVHDPESASSQWGVYESLISEIAEILDALKTTPFRDGQSMLDVTTVVICSEFGRTIKQFGTPVSESGSDHNPWHNTVLLAGKGIKKGLVVGGTDGHSLNDARTEFSDLMPFHRNQDNLGQRLYGRPIDFSTLRPATAAPEEFRIDDHLTYTSLLNTILYLMGIDSSHYYPNERNGGPAPVLHRLMS